MQTPSFGPLWIDQPDWLKDHKYTAARAAQKEALETFVRDGFVILKAAIPAETIDQIVRDTHAILDQPDHYVFKSKGRYADPVGLDSLERGMRILDLYAVSPAARDAIMGSPVSDFLNLIFGEPPIAMQSLSFEYGSQQSIHQDTAYVVSGKPLSLAASWIALEDVTPGSGELIYYPGSHRFRHFLFSQAHKSWVPERDGQDQHQAFLRNLHSQAKEMGIEQDSFIAQKGDVLIWHADLAHGGAKIKQNKTRQSLVAHYCPQSVKPRYMAEIKDSYVELEHPNNGFFTSRHYDLKEVDDQTMGRIIYDGEATQRARQTTAPTQEVSGFWRRLFKR